MSELLNSLNRQLALEQAKKQKNQNMSVNLSDVISMASNNDKILSSTIEGAYESVKNIDTIENFNAQIKRLEEFSKDAVLKETKSLFKIGIADLKRAKDFTVQRNTFQSGFLDQVNSLKDDDDVEAVKSLTDNLNSGIKSGFYNTESFKIAQDAFNSKLESLQEIDAFQATQDFASNLGKYVKAGPQKIADEQINAVGRGADLQTLRDLTSDFTASMDKTTEALSKLGTDEAVTAQNEFYIKDEGFHQGLSGVRNTLSTGNMSLTTPNLYTYLEQKAVNYSGQYGGDTKDTKGLFNVEQLFKDQIELIDRMMLETNPDAESQRLYKRDIDIIKDPNDSDHRFTTIQFLETLEDGFAKNKNANKVVFRDLTRIIKNRLNNIYDNAEKAYGFGGNWGKSYTKTIDDGMKEVQKENVKFY
tara:strand:- start:33027 stop:34277 length:1251 start_codon:yes stop_codon:yes gene_type:complete